MKYSIGQNLADFVFSFFEKIHEPIFLVSRIGRVTKINEAGRKLMSVAKVGLVDLENLAQQVCGLFRSSGADYRRLRVKNTNLNLIVRSLRDSDFILVEVKR